MRKRNAGVSLLETIMAATLLSGSVMMVCSLSARSLRSVRLNQEYEKAWDFVNRQMVIIDSAGVETLAEAGGLNGQSEGLDGKTWQWKAEASETEIAQLYDVSVEIEWFSASGQVRNVRCDSRLVGDVLDSSEGPGQLQAVGGQ